MNAIAVIGEQLLQPVEVRARRVAQRIDQLRRRGDRRLHRRVLAVEDAQRVGVQPPLRVVVEQLAVPLEMRDQRARCARRSSASPIELISSRDAVEPEPAPQPRQHHDLLGVDVGPGKAERLDVELVELAVAALLRALVAEHRPGGPHALRPLVGQVVLDRRAHDARGRLGAQRQALAVQPSSNVYISFSTTSVTSPIARTNSGVASTIGVRRLR